MTGALRRALLGAALFLVPPALLAQGAITGATPGSFRVTESGAAEYRIPIRVSPGIAGMEPKLALVYNSQAGNGMLGVGWNLEGLSSITRCPRTVAQDGVRGGVNYDANDRYCLDGQRLIAISGSYGADGTEYRTERESFTKVVSYGVAGNGPAWFKAWTRSGQIIEYGNTADSRIEAQGKTSVRVWAVNKFSDRKSTYQTVSYAEDSANGDFRIARIDYSGNAGAGQATTASVQFEYETRTDVPTGYQAGSVEKIQQRLRFVKTFLQTANLTSYRIDYETGSTTSQSRVTAVQECVAGGTTCLPPVSLGYGASTSGISSTTTDLFSLTGADYSSANFQFGDINGDGKPDIIVTRFASGIGELKYALWEGSGYGPFTTLFSWPGCNCGAYSITLGDLNGDGKVDLLRTWTVNGRAEVHYALSTGTGFGAFQQVIYWDGPYNFSGYRFQLADIDGDGRADLIGTRNEYGKAEVFYYLWTGSGFGPGNTVIDWAGPYDYTWHGFQFPDINGDGRADLVVTRAENGRAEVNFALYNGTGYGPLQSVFEWGGPYNYIGHSYQFADVNGDGKADLIVIRAEYIGGVGTAWAIVALSTGQGFGSFTTIFDWGSAPWQDMSLYKFQTADLNGDGRADFIWSRSYSTQGNLYYSLSKGTSWGPMIVALDVAGDYSRTKFHMVDLQGKGRADLFIGSANNPNGTGYDGAGSVRYSAFSLPDLPSSITSSAGLSTALTWKPATDNTVYTKDTTAAYPVVDLAPPMHVISQVALPNGIGGTEMTAYAYGGLKAELGTGRGMLGFRWTESTQQSTGLKVRTEHRQDWPYLGLPSSMKKTQSSGAVLSEATSTYGCINAATGGACAVAVGNRYFPFVSQSVESGADLDGAALPTVTTSTQYDGFGNPTSIAIGTADGHSKTTTNIFSNDAANWLLGRLRRSTVQSASP